MKHKAGTEEWRDSIKARMRKRHGLKQDDNVGLTVMPAEVAVDSADPLLFTARITKRVLDRDGEVVLPSGGIFTEFDKSGAIFWNHEYDLPVAVPMGEIKSTPDHVLARARFIERVEGQQGEFMPDYARAFVAAMGKANRSAGVSIGFVPLEERRPTSKDKQDYGPDVRNVITKWKMLEWSIAPVQANQESYVTTVGKSIGNAACKALFGVEPEPERPELDVSHVVERIERVKAERQYLQKLQDRVKRERVKRDRLRLAKRIARMKAAPDLAIAKARGELYPGQYEQWRNLQRG